MAAVAEDESKKEHTFYRAVYDAKNSFAEFQLPGELIRAEGQPAAKDKAVNDAYDNVGQVLSAYKQLFNWNSVDNDNMHIISTVHFGENYENACKLPTLPDVLWCACPKRLADLVTDVLFVYRLGPRPHANSIWRRR